MSQDDSIPFTTPVNYYSTLVWHHFLHTLLIKVFQLCVWKFKTNYWSMGDNKQYSKEVLICHLSLSLSFLSGHTALTPYYRASRLNTQPLRVLRTTILRHYIEEQYFKWSVWISKGKGKGYPLKFHWSHKGEYRYRVIHQMADPNHSPTHRRPGQRIGTYFRRDVVGS